MGYHRADGQVGTRNYWLVLPLVFCENRNVDRMREALEEELGYGNFAQQLSPAGSPDDHKAGEARPTGITPESTLSLRSCLPQHRWHSLPHPPGWLRWHAPGRAGSLRPSRRIHPPSQRRRSHRAQPRLPERAILMLMDELRARDPSSPSPSSSSISSAPAAKPSS